MKKNLPSQLAIGIIILITILIGGIFMMLGEKKNIEEIYNVENGHKKGYVTKQIKVSRDENRKGNEAENCKKRFFDGEAKIRVWIVNEEADGDLKIKVQSQDIELLPSTRIDVESADFVAMLVDPSPELKDKLKEASEENPMPLDVRGYAVTCDNLPLLSTEQASKSFKQI